MTETTATTGEAATCLCGCGRPTKGKFAPGHDARLVGQAARAAAGTDPLPGDHWLSGLSADAMHAAIAQRASDALARKFDGALAKAVNRPTRKPRRLKVVTVELPPACPTCGAEGDAPCLNRAGRKLPMGKRHADRETVFAS